MDMLIRFIKNYCFVFLSLFSISAFADIKFEVPEKIYMGQAIPIRIEGLKTDQITIRVVFLGLYKRSFGRYKRTLGVSNAVFKPDKGIVDLSQQAPLSGSYQGVNPAGLFYNQYKLKQGSVPNYILEMVEQTRIMNLKKHIRNAYLIFVTDQKDQLLFFKKIVVHNGDFFKTIFLETPYHGFLITQRENGVFKTERKARKKRGIIYFPGSGNAFPAPMLFRLAARGFPVFMYKYRKDGSCLDHIPIENLVHAVDWFIKKYELDEVIFFGVSKGVEASVLTASQNQHPLAGMILMSGAGVFTDGSQGPFCLFTAYNWALKGKELPYLSSMKGGFFPFHYLYKSQRQAYEYALKHISDEALKKVLLPSDQIRSPLLVFGSGKDEYGNTELGARIICKQANCDEYPSRYMKIFKHAEHDIIGTGWFSNGCAKPKQYVSYKACLMANGDASWQAMQMIEDFLNKIREGNWKEPKL